jgi:hypothetical protein
MQKILIIFGEGVRRLLMAQHYSQMVSTMILNLQVRPIGSRVFVDT